MHRINPRQCSERGGHETSQCPLWVKSRHSQSLLDDFVSTRKKSLRHFEAKRLRCLKVDREFVFSWCLYRKVSRFLALQDAIDVSCAVTKVIDWVGAIGNEASLLDEVARGVCSGQPMPSRQCYDLFAMTNGGATQRHDQSNVRAVCSCSYGALYLLAVTCIDRGHLYTG